MMRNVTSNNTKAGFRRIAALALALVLAFGALMCLAPERALAAGYSDTATHWAKDAIDRWSGYGVLKGVTETRFEPDRSVTRAEFLTIINRAFGATATADVSGFRDVTSQSWYYYDIARAVKMGTTNGTSATTMSPGAAVTRQEAIVILARALGIYADGYATLQTFRDASQVAPYARTHVSAFVDLGYISGFSGYINPTDKLSRAEAVTILDNIFSEIATASGTLSSSKSVLVRTAGLTLSGNVAGDFIIADGVGTGDVTLKDLTISGRLVIRGGGANSVHMTGVTARGGTFVQNPNGATRLVLSGSSVGNVTARTDVIIDGAGASAVTVPAGLAGRTAVTLNGAALDAVNISSPADVKLTSGTVNTVYFQQGANGSTFDIATGAKVSGMSIGAQNVTVTGGGMLEEVSINASGARISMSPKSYYIGDNLSAVIAGVTRYGRVAGDTISNVSRANSALYVTQNAAFTGGSGLSMNTATGQNGNRVTVSQAANATVPLSMRNNRLAYWIGFFIPNPGDSTSSVSVTYEFDGAKTTQSFTQTIQNGVRGLEIAIPVTRYEDGGTRGELGDEIFITWGSGLYETLTLGSGALELSTPTAAETATLVNYFSSATFSAYNGVMYTGTEAIRRLLASDNALGLDRRGFTALAESGMNNVAIKLNGEKNLLTTKKAIQERLLLALAGEGAFFAINRATNAEQVKGIIELNDFGYQIGISDADMSKYYTLSQAGRLSVAKTVLLSRGTDYKTEADLAKTLLAAVDTVRATEVTLLTSINAARTREELQKLLENKANNLLIDIVTDADPYKSLNADKKAYVIATILDAKPFTNLDEVRSLFISLVGVAGIPDPDPEKVVSVSVDTTVITIEVGATAVIDATVTTSAGTNEDVSFTSSNTNVATVSNSGTVRGETKGSAKVTVASAQDSTKKTTVTVTVVEPVPATAIALSSTSLEVGEGGQVTVRVTLTPAGSTSHVQWASDNENIVTVSGDGKSAIIKGLKPGVTRISARVEKESLSASCAVTVVAKEKGVAVYPATATVGPGTSKQLQGVVSPISLSDRRVTWKSSDPSIATVNPNGLVTGVSTLGQPKATVTITATSISDPTLSASCVVTVDPTMKGITLSKTEITLYRGGAETIEATVVPLGSGEPVDWSWDSKYVDAEFIKQDGVTLDNKMMLTGKAAGTFTLMASLRNDSSVYVECKVTVLSSSITVTIPKTLSIYVGDRAYIPVTFKPDTIENKNVTWSTDDEDEEIIKIDPVSGRIEAVSTGAVGAAKTTIKVYGIPDANKAVTLECSVTVNEVAVKSIKLDPANMTIKIGEQRKITAIVDPANYSGTIEWSTPDTSVASVTKDGYVMGVGPYIVKKTMPLIDATTGLQKLDNDGKPMTYEEEVLTPITITATIGGKTATCQVTVTEEEYEGVEMIEIGLDTWVFPVGFAQSLRLKFNGETGNLPADRQVQWTSSNERVAEVDANGYMICKEAGVTTITVITADTAVTDSKKVVVANNGLTSIKLAGLSTDYTKGKWVSLDLTGSNRQRQITATPADDNATDKRVTWVSSDTNIVTVSSNGMLTAQNPGWAKITVQPTQLTCYGVALPGAPNVIQEAAGAGPNLDIADYRGSGLYIVSGVYHSPNPKRTSNDTTEPVPLDPATPTQLVVENKITDGSNEFWVFVAPASGSTEHALTLTSTASEVNSGSSAELTAALNWGNSISPDGVEWSVTPSTGLALSKEQSVTTAGRATATVTASASGTYTVTAKVTVPEIKGVPTVANGPAPTLQKAQTLTATYTITVEKKPAESVTISGAAANTVVYLGETLQLSAVVMPTDASDKNVAWESDDETVLTVDGNGKVTAAGLGAATITATATDGTGKHDSVLLIVRKRPAISGITLSVSGSKTVVLGEDFTLTATVLPADALPGTLTWHCSNTDVAVLSGTGNLSRKVIGYSVGTATITVSATDASGTYTATCEVTVAASGAAGSFKMTISLPDDTGDASGETVPAPSNAPAPESVRLRSSATVVVGNTLTLMPYLTPSDASKDSLIWESASPSVATVDKGVVTGVKAGSAKITAKDASGKIKATCTVTVKASDARPVTSISISKKTLTLNVGSSSTLTVSYKPSNATVKGVTWTSGNEKVARVEPSGKVIAVSGGKAVITARSDSGGFTASCEVTVNVPVKSVTISETAITLKVGETYQLGATTDPVDATSQTAAWKSSSTSRATVSDNGLVTAKKTGTVTITVTIGGKKATCKVTIVK